MPRQLAAHRHRDILRRLDVAETVSVEELADALAVSRETIRRDLKQLAAASRLTVVHGGAVRRDLAEPPLAERRGENPEGRAVVADLAAGLVAPGMSVLLDSGATTEVLARALLAAEPQRLTVHTVSLAAARVMARLPGIRVHLVGGELEAAEDATGGPETLRAIGRLRADIAFVGVGGVAPDGRITDYTRAGATLRGAMLAAAESAYFLADHRKFGLRLASPVPDQDRAAGLVVDIRPDRRLARALAGAGMQVVAPGS